MTHEVVPIRKKYSAAVGLAAMVFLWAVSAAPAQAGDVKVSNAIANVREDAMNGRRIEIYMTIENSAGGGDRLYAVRSKMSRKTMLSVVQDGGHGNMAAGHGMMENAKDSKHMQTSVLDLPAGETVVLQRGGSHIMLMEPEMVPSDGDSFPVILFFERAGRVSVDVTVKPMEMNH
jgi:copper(I)-binding protein